MSRPLVLDLFAGPGGWSEGLRAIGMSDVGLEWDRDACRTRAAAGHKTVRCDVAGYPVEPFVGKVRGLIASPPCQAFSMAGNRLGMLDLGRIHAAVEAARTGWRDELRAGEWADPRSALILEPLRWTWALRPEWVACEQVPPALAVWEHMADVLRSWGYAATAVRLLAADYGVPQTRLRAFLLAHRTRVSVPAPTHAKLPTSDLFGPELLPWVSMASALGWTAGERAIDRRVGGFAADAELDANASPAHSVTGKTGSWKLTNNNRPNSAVRSGSEAAPVLYFGHRMNAVRWVEERPATTICNEIVSGPGHRDMGPKGVHRQDAEGSISISISISEAAVLQSFPADYPFQGSKTARFRQVGDAVPPMMAAAIIKALAA